jgi:NDP-mannose synthase
MNGMAPDNLQVVILAGGKGTRLLPYTTVFPKPLVPLGQTPILEVVVRQLRWYGCLRLTFAVNHMADLIEAYFGNGSKWGVAITYSREDEPLGTAAPLALVPELDENFLVMNGDVLTTIDYRALMQEHIDSGALVTLATYRKEVQLSLGVVDIGGDGRLRRYTEKPSFDYQVSMGVYAFNRRVLDFIAAGERLDLPDLMTRLMDAGEHVHCFDFRGQWLDIGRPEDYSVAVDVFERDMDLFIPASKSPWLTASSS